MDVPQAQLDPWHTWTLELFGTLGPLSYLAQLDPWAPSLDPLAHLDQQTLRPMGPISGPSGTLRPPEIVGLLFYLFLQ